MTATQTLLDASEPSPFEIVNAGFHSKLVLVCDHASNRLPTRLGNLGLSAIDLASHIGWDSGAAEVARKLSARLDVPLVISTYSRLVIDCNRWPIAADSIPLTGGGIAIPGNAGLSDSESFDRRLALFEPYQAEVAEQLNDAAANCILLSIHSFTPTLFGVDRPWSIGVCYHNDLELARCWRDVLRVSIGRYCTDPETELVVNNEPYDIEAGCDYTIPVQGESCDIPSIMLEIRQDKTQDEAGVRLWSDIIADAWQSIQSEYSSQV